MKYLCILFFVAICTLTACAQSSSLTVVIIRHGEKNEATGNLSCKGLHRAMLLPPVLKKQYPHISYIYVPTISAGKSTTHSRMFQTATPFAVENDLSVNSKYAQSAADDVAADILKRTGFILVVWEHENIPDIAYALGVKDKHLKWDDADFDSIWTITYATDKKGRLKATLTVGSEGLHPVDTCNF